MEETKKCTNCEKDIEVSKFFLHERFCSQNVKKCSVCGKPIIIEDEEDHMKEAHTKIQCEFCKKEFAGDQIEQHKKTCDFRTTECKYCGLEVLLKDKFTHEEACGAKTELCPTCEQYIKVKDFPEHQKKGCKKPSKENKINNNIPIEEADLELAYKKSLKEARTQQKNKKNISSDVEQPFKYKVSHNPRPILSSNQVKDDAKNDAKNNAEPELPLQSNKNPVLKNQTNNTNKQRSQVTKPFNQTKPQFTNSSKPFRNQVQPKKPPATYAKQPIANSSSSTKPKISSNGTAEKPRNEKTRNGADSSKKSVKPFSNKIKFGPNYKKSNNENSLRESKTSFKFDPKISSMNNSRTNVLNNMPKKASRKYDWQEYEQEYDFDDDYGYQAYDMHGLKHDDIHQYNYNKYQTPAFNGNFNKNYAYAESIEDRQLAEAIERSLKQK